MKIAAQLYTLRDYIQTKEDLDNTLGRVKNMGFDTVQLSAFGYIDDNKANYIKELTDKYGLEICVTHMGLEQLTNELDRLIKYHQLWDCKYIGLGAMPEEFRSKEGYVRFAEIANQIGNEISKEGMSFVYHNHRFEFEKFDGKTGMDILADGFNEHVQFLLDTYWVQDGGVNPALLIRKLKGKVDVVHFKDYGIKKNQVIMTEVGSGNLNWHEIIEACKYAGVKYAAIERDSGETDPFDTLEISRKYLREEHQL